MKLFPHISINALKIGLATLFSFAVLSSCATYSTQYGKKSKETIVAKETVYKADISHTYYLLGNTGFDKNKSRKKHFDKLSSFIDKGEKESTLVFLGNSIDRGMAKEGAKSRGKVEEILAPQLGLAKDFKGNTVFINGNAEWARGYEGVKRFSDYMALNLEDKKAVLPRKVCGFERLKINDETVLIAVDSEWYLQDWDKQPNINEDCDIKTREDFFDELRGEINKNQNRIVVLAMHHPVYSNGNYGGHFSFKDHIYPLNSNVPLPIIGSIINYTRALSGINIQDLQSKNYNEFNKRIRTMAQMYDNVVIASAHEQNLQYIAQDGVKQVISGGMAETTPSRAILPDDISIAQAGFTTLEIMKDRSVVLNFYGFDEKGVQLVTQKKIFEPSFYVYKGDDEVKEGLTKASVYPVEWTKKTAWYRFLWGKHYRDIYSRPVEVEIADLTKIKGGLTPTISGGGNQSMSLRVVDKEGKEYVMRGVRKSVSRFVQTAVFKDQYVMNSFQDTWAERFIYDFYTTSHPYTPFIISDLSEAIGMFHTNPELYYIPKQKTLGRFNENYGDELYMIEERPTSGFEDEDSFGNATKIVSTTDVIANLRKDEKYAIDQKAFLRARIFDMLIGDWDRHGDQWRWSEFKEEGKVIYKPVPRDRDQAFAKIDGALLSLIKKLPPLRHMQSYKEDFANPRWLNKTAFPLDQYLLKSTSEEDWITEAKDIVTTLSDEVIEEVFAKLPKEVQDKEIDEIKRILTVRKSNIVAYLPKYYAKLREYVIVAGTDKKDFFDIERLPNGDVKLTQYRDKKLGKELEFEKVYSAKQTKEIWIYGLNDEDEYIVRGEGKAKIKLRLIGGKNQDTYVIENPGKTIVYDYADKKNEIVEKNGVVRKYSTNKYDLNNFNYEKVPVNINMLLPNIGFNPEDGIKLGFMYSSTRMKFLQDPFTSKHELKGFYSFNTKGLEAEYKGYFPNTKNNWMFTLGARATSPNFAKNYYGIGNETYYFDKEEGDDYKRVRIESYSIAPGYRYEGKQGGSFEVNLGYDALKVQNKSNRFITSSPEVVNQKVFDFQQYGSFNVEYNYEQYNYPANPTVGFGFNSKAGWRMNLEDTKQNFAYLDMRMNFIHFIDRGERFVFATNFTYQTRFNDNYDFYHAATVGGNANLRGFRPERFTGKTSFVQTTDIRFNAGQFTAGFIPMSYGFYAGFDYGRVWTPLESSNKWHNAYGAGFWINAIEQATLHCSYFNSVDGGRFVFGLGFGF